MDHVPKQASAQPVDDATLPDTSSVPNRPVVTRARAGIGAGTIAGIVYLMTMHRAVGFVDSGEVAAVASTLGIMHPTGYPTITMLGHLVTLITPGRDIIALHVLAALLAGAGVGVMAVLFDVAIAAVLGRQRDARHPRAGRGGRLGSSLSRTTGKASAVSAAASDGTPISGSRSSMLSGVAAFLALFVGFSDMWWEQATVFEVYSLQALMLPLIALLFLRFVDDELERRRSGQAAPRLTRAGVLFAVALGLAFTNHMMTILLAPAFLLYYFWSLGINRSSLRRLLFLVPPFIVGLLPYLYLPIRSSKSPRFNWGRPDTWDRFIHHVSGRFAWDWMFSSSEVFDAQTSYFFDRLPSELAYAGLALALVGIVIVLRRNARLGALLILLFVGCAAYAGSFRIYDVELYYVPAIVALGLASVGAFAWLLERSATAALGLAAALAVANLALHFDGSDRSDNHLAEDFAFNTLTTAPENTIVFSSDAAALVTVSDYLQAVEGIRPDVTVINQDYLSLLWYLDELAARRPDLMQAVAAQVATYRAGLEKVESGEPFDAFGLTNDHHRLVQAIVDWQLSRGSVIVAGEVEVAFGTRYRPVPWHLGYRLVNDSSYVAQPFPAYRYRAWDEIDPLAASVHEAYGRRLSYRASYEAEHGRDSLARVYNAYALTFDPRYDLLSAPPLPLDAMTQVIATTEFYDRLRARISNVRAR